MPRRFALRYPLLMASLVVGACGGDGPTDPRDEGPDDVPPATVTLSVSFPSDTAVLDRWADTVTAVATVRDQNGATPSGVSLAWQTLDPAIAQVSSTGVIQSVALGTTRVRVTARRQGSADAQRELTVRVVAQENAQCIAPAPVSRGPASGAITFGPAQILTQLPSRGHDGSRSLAADYDGDGDTDVVRLEYSYPTSNPYTGTVRVFRNDAGVLTDRTTTVVQGSIVPDHPRDFEVRDFTGDGVADLYVAQHGFDATPFPGAPNLFLTRSGAQLTDAFAARFSPAHAKGFSHGSAAADVDCDGDADIAELNLTAAALNQLLLNNGSGQFTAASAAAFPIAAGASGQRWQELEFVDFDADGDPDLYLGARSGPGWNEDVLLVNDGFGRFRQRAGVTVPPPAYTPVHAANNAKSADFNGDGRQDLILFEIPQPFSTSSAIRLWLNNGTGGFADAGAAWGLPAQCTAEVVEPLYVRDFNGDGWPDVLVPNGCPNLGGAGILVNTGSGFRFVGYSTIEPWLGQDPATPIDVDRDGKLDLFFGERGGNPVLVRVQ